MCDSCDLRCYPEITGKSNSPVSDLHNERPFAAGNAYSASAVYDSDHDVTKKTVGALAIEYGFDIIPDTEETRAAGYTDATRENGHVWYGPSADDKHFYYFASTGGGLPPALDSFFVCRKIKDGELVYAVNCVNYRLDTSANFMFNSKIFCRMTPALHGDTVYIGLSILSNIGPIVAAINKSDGSWKWSLAYKTPIGAPPTINTVGDYSAFRGSNTTIMDSNLIVKQDEGDEYPTIICGSSSFANLGLDPGTRAGGFPFYTDQGGIFKIEDRGTTGVLVGKTLTCAPILNAGDVVSNTGPDTHNPFFPGLDYTVIFTTSGAGGLIDRYQFVTGDPYVPFPALPATNNSSPVSTFIRFTNQTVIDLSIFQQQAWSVTSSIYADANRTLGRTRQQWVDAWIIEQQTLPNGVTATHQIWAYLSPVEQALLTANNNSGLGYFKIIYNNSAIQNANDANALGYWGNSVWGAPASNDGDDIYFGSGQAHSMPFFELAYFSGPARDFSLNKFPLVTAQNNYVNGTGTLGQVNDAADTFLGTMKNACVNSLRSPRGVMSYSNAMLSVKFHNDALRFAVRTMPSDNWGAVPRLLIILGSYGNGSDGDASSGMQIFNTGRKKIATATKSGIGIVVDIQDIDDNVVFNGTNLNEKGVFIDHYQYLGGNATWGGSNYQCGQSTGRYLYSCQGNTPLVYQTVPPMSEIFVTRDGVVFPGGKAYIIAMNIDSGDVPWVSSLQALALSQIEVVNGVVFAADSTGKLYGFNAFNGDELMRIDNATSAYPTFGGTSTPLVTKKRLIWIPVYKLPPYPGRGSKYGISLRVDHSNVVDKCETNYNWLNNYEYINVIGTTTVDMEWKKLGDMEVDVTYTDPSSTFTTKFKMELVDPVPSNVLTPCEDRYPKLVFELVSGDPEISAVADFNVFSEVSYTVYITVNGVKKQYLFTRDD